MKWVFSDILLYCHHTLNRGSFGCFLTAFLAGARQRDGGLPKYDIVATHPQRSPNVSWGHDVIRYGSKLIIAVLCPCTRIPISYLLSAIKPVLYWIAKKSLCKQAFVLIFEGILDSHMVLSFRHCLLHVL